MNPERSLVLGHNRLSIIDLSEAGHQPMRNEQTGDVIVFNGEIYNYRALRRELAGIGHRFVSGSDTEVLLRAFAEWGIGCLDRLHGMYAFALWSARERMLHLVRDPMGIKPLYYWTAEDGTIVFASEIKALLRFSEIRPVVRRRSLEQYLEFGYTFDEEATILNGVRKLPPGHRLEARPGASGRPIRHFDPALEPLVPDAADRVTDDLYAVLDQVVEEHLVADVPVGLLLSGGLDSSLIAALAARHQPIRTFSFGFARSAIDERPQARRVAEFIGTEHQELLIEPAAVMEDLTRNAGMFDDLFADWGTLSTRYLYLKCRELGVKVVIVGEGSDELFGGYGVFSHAQRRRIGQPMDWRLFQLYRAYTGRRYGSQYWQFRRRMRGYLAMTNGDLFAAIRLFETRDQLPNNYVMKVDKASMSVSVEARVPFLDDRVARIAYRLPREQLIGASGNKLILREIARRHRLLPEETLARTKFGAGIAMGWMDDNGGFRAKAREVILSPGNWTEALGLRDAMRAYFDRGRQGYPAPHRISIFRNLAWRLLLLELWSDAFSVEARA